MKTDLTSEMSCSVEYKMMSKAQKAIKTLYYPTDAQIYNL